LEGEEVETEAEELLSRAVQHETDHLEGKLFIDYLSADEAKKAAQKVEGFEREFREMQASGTLLDDEALRRRLDELAAGAPWGIMDGERPAIGSVDP
jgi:peptide deformylase